MQTVAMALTAAQVTVVFEGASHAAITRNTRVQLQTEEMTDHSDLADFTKEAMDMISQNLRRPGGGSKTRIMMMLKEPPRQHHIPCL